MSPLDPPVEASGSRPRAAAGPLDPAIEPSGPQKRQASGPNAKAPKKKERVAPFAQVATQEGGSRGLAAPILALVVVGITIVAAIVIGVKPRPPPHSDLPSAAVTMGRQQDLVQRAGNMLDHKRALATLDDAIAMDKTTRGARVAMIERVRRLLALSRYDDAHETLSELKARPDAAEIATVLDELQTKIAAMRKATRPTAE